MPREKEVNSFPYAKLVTISLGSLHKIRDDLHSSLCICEIMSGRLYYATKFEVL